MSSAASFYIHAYLWQIIGIALFLTSIFLIFKKNWRVLLVLVFSGIASIVIALPGNSVYNRKQISSPFLLGNYGAHQFNVNRDSYKKFLNYSRWVIIAIVLGLIVLYLNFRKKEIYIAAIHLFRLLSLG